MHITHAKSPCCKATIVRFGGRRRQCTVCLGTWRIRKKKRGRKPRRVTPAIATRHLNRELPSLRILAKKRFASRETTRRHFQKSMRAVIRTAHWQPTPSDGALIAIADAFAERIGGKEYTSYLILLKPTDATHAVIVPPLFLFGHEDLRGWTTAFRKLPLSVRARIRALVCDGHGGLRGVAIDHHWIIQRCHFHLKLGIGNYLSRSKLARQKVLSFLVNQSIDILLTSRVPHQVRRARAHLTLLLMLCRSAKLRGVLNGCLRHLREYRTYLRHPFLHLPITTNACESLIRCVRAVLASTRGFRTFGAFARWVTAHLKHRKTITCRGFDQPN